MFLHITTQITQYCKFQFAQASTTGRRQTNEDAEVITEKNDIKFCAIYDGHGGNQASVYSSVTLHNEIFQNYQVFSQQDDQIQKMIMNAFNITDKKYIAQENAEDILSCSGCTATVLVQYKNNLYFANAGDSRSIVIDNNFIAKQITEDHKPNLQREKERIEQYGSTVTQQIDDCPRVAGMLAVSRAIGDCPFKGCGVISTPDVYKYNAENVQYIVMGCDGLWDVLTNNEVSQIIQWFINAKNNVKSPYQGTDLRLQQLYTATMAYCQSKTMADVIAQNADIQLDKVLKVGLCTNVDEIVIKETEKFTAKHLAMLLVRLAVAIGSIDNVSVIVGIKQQK